MRASLRQVIFDPDPRTLPGDPEGFAFVALLLAGPSDGPGEESFDVTVCSPEWLAQRCRAEGIVDGLHHVIIDWDGFDERKLRSWLEVRVGAVEEPTWEQAADRLSRLGWWEFDGYPGHTG